MEDVIQLVIAKKVIEALALLGVSDYSQESAIKEHILTLADFVRDARLKAGKEDTPDYAPLRESLRILSYAAKRGRTDYQGLDGPVRKKRLKAGRVKRSLAASVPPDGSTSENDRDCTANEHDQPSDRPENDIDPAAANKSDQLKKASENDVATAKNNDQPSEAVKNDAETAAGKENDQCNEHNSGRDRPNDGLDRMDGNAATQPRDEIQHTAVISANPANDPNKTSALDNATPPDESQQSVSTTQATVACATVGMGGELVSNTDCCASPESLTEAIQNVFPSASAMEAMETILWSCATLNYTLGRHSWSSNATSRTDKTSDMRKYAEQMLSWDFESALQAIRNEKATLAHKDIQGRYIKSIYWKIITKYADSLDPSTLPSAKGRLDEFTMAEKTATKAFMKNAGIALSNANQRRCRRFWKSLSDMREAGVDKILFYGTKEFDSFCEEHRTGNGDDLVQTVLSWENVYGLHLEHLEERAKKEGAGDRTGRLWLAQPHVVKRLHVPEASWNNARNMWFSAEEEEQFASIPRQTKAPADQLGGLLDDIPAAAGGHRNKFIFVSLIPRNEEFFSVCPIITIQEGDFLGIFAGMIRYCEKFDSMYGIRGPSDNLWLDYSQVTGLLNQMSVSSSNGQANVQLQWELYEESGGRNCPLTWRVSVRALRTIRPFEELIRTAPNSEQCLRHRKLTHARRGFLKENDALEHR